MQLRKFPTKSQLPRCIDTTLLLVPSHNFAKLYVVDLFKYLKDKGRDLSDNSTELDDDEKEDVTVAVDDIDKDPDILPVDSSGFGQSCYPVKRKLSEEEGG